MSRRLFGCCLALLALALGGERAFGAAGREWLVPSLTAAADPLRVAEDLVDETQQLKDQLLAVKRESQERHALTIARGRAYVRLARAGLLPLSDGFEALAAHASRLERLRRALGRDMARQRQLTARRLELAHALDDLDALRPAQRHALDRARTAIAAAEERDRAYARAFPGDPQQGPTTAVYGARVRPSPSVSGGGFAAQRGRLPFPIAGRAEMFKRRSSTGTGRALFMVGADGASVRAVYPGHVAFAADYPNLGNTVILEHGDGFYTVSAHLQRIDVEVGEDLEAGQRLGTVGSYENERGLLFEVRAGKDTVDTPDWFGI
jgi:septal ring factor EnvC (AmiA/AmiB activator)